MTTKQFTSSPQPEVLQHLLLALIRQMYHQRVSLPCLTRRLWGHAIEYTLSRESESRLRTAKALGIHVTTIYGYLHGARLKRELLVKRVKSRKG